MKCYKNAQKHFGMLSMEEQKQRLKGKLLEGMLREMEHP